VAKNTSYQHLTSRYHFLYRFLNYPHYCRKFGRYRLRRFYKITSLCRTFLSNHWFRSKRLLLQYENARFKTLSIYYVNLRRHFLLLKCDCCFSPYNAVLGTGFSAAGKIWDFIIFPLAFSRKVLFSPASAIFQKQSTIFFIWLGWYRFGN